MIFRVSRRQWFLAAALTLMVSSLRVTGCADACEEAVDHCFDCDLETATCRQRFEDAPEKECRDAVDAYRRAGCDPYAGRRCNAETGPLPTR